MLAERLADRSEPQQADDPGALAAEALRLVGIDASLADATATHAIAVARRARDLAAESTGWRARGLAAREVEQLELAESHLRRAVSVGRRAGDQPMAEAQMSLALVMLGRGNLPGARRTARRAVAALSGREQARARIQLALIEQRSGALREALDTYAMGLTQLRRYGDELWEARLRNNRGILQAYRGEVAAAERDLARAEELYRGQGQEVLAADVLWNRGFVATLRDDTVGALRIFDEAGALWDTAGVSRGVRYLDRCQLLLSVGLVEEARTVIEAGIRDLKAHDVGSDLAEAQLLLAETYLATDTPENGRASAVAALMAFVAQGRPTLALLARYAILRATTDLSDPLWGDALDVAQQLDLAGWHIAATDVRLLLAQRDLLAGRVVRPEILWLAERATRGGAAGQRMRAWHAVALGRLSKGDVQGAKSALRAGLAVHDKHRSTMTATELQVRIAARAADLAMAGLRLAVDERHASSVLAWAERWRSGSLAFRPVQPPSDPALAAQLAELRAVTAELEQARLDGTPAESLARRQQSLELTVAARARTSSGDMRRTAQASTIALRGLLDGRALVEFIEDRGGVLAVVLTRSGASLHELGNVRSVRVELEALRFALRRLALGGSPRMVAAAEQSMRMAAARLDDQLLRPLLSRITDRSLVLIPTGELHALPWALLPTCGSRAVTVSPSSSVWLAAEATAPRFGAVTVVAGPELRAARAEATGVGEVYGERATVLLPGQASVDAVLASIDGASCAHIAAHGAFRAENPLFSSLQMSDGPLTVYDLERLAQVPQLVVLSACDSGLSMVHPGNELMGLVGALLRLGTRALVASVAPVPDSVAQATMVAMHRRLRAGSAPAVALHGAIDTLNDEDRLRATAFVCFGAG